MWYHFSVPSLVVPLRCRDAKVSATRAFQVYFDSILRSKKLEQRSIFPGAMYGVSALVIHAVLLTIRNMAAMQRCFASPESIRSASPRSKHVKACREHPAGCTPEKGKAGVECLKIFGPGKARSKS